MASAFSHAIAALAIGKASFIKKADWKFWLLGMFCAVVPDADAIGYNMGIPYESMWGHRGITHSFFFAALLSLAILFFFYRQEKRFSGRWWALFVIFFAATASHPVLDAMTTGGKGVAFFAPFENSRYFFPFRPIKVSPISISRFFSERGWQVIQSEFVWVWIPSFAIMGITYLIRKLAAR